MKKLLLSAVLLAATAVGAQAHGSFEVYDMGTFSVHVYATGDALGDASYIIEGADALVTLEEPLFKANVSEFGDYIAKIGKPVVKRIADYHLGGTGAAPVVMAEGMSSFVKSGPYAAMMESFAAGFGDLIVALPTGEAEEVPFGGVETWDGVTFLFEKGAATDFPAASILIGEKVYFTHWAPAKAHMSALQLTSLAAVDAEIVAAEASLASGAKLFIGGHGGAADAETVLFKIEYLKTLKQLVAANADADAFAAALADAYPELPGADNIAALAQALYK